MGLFDMFRKQEDVPKAEKLVVEDDELEVDAEADEEEPEEFEKEAPADRAEEGPFDESEADAATNPGGYIDFGALRIPAREGSRCASNFSRRRAESSPSRSTSTAQRCRCRRSLRRARRASGRMCAASSRRRSRSRVAR